MTHIRLDGACFAEADVLDLLDRADTLAAGVTIAAEASGEHSDVTVYAREFRKLLKQRWRMASQTINCDRRGGA